MSVPITGKIFNISSINQVTDTFRKSELVLEVPSNDSQYRNVLVLEAINDTCDIVAGFEVGDEIEGAYHYSGNIKPWINKSGVEQWFNSLKLSFIKKVGEQPAATPQYQAPVQQQASVNPPVPTEDDSEIPF